MHIGIETHTHTHTPFIRRMRAILVPVTALTRGIPKESRSTTPIWEGVKPFLASLQIWSTTSLVVVFTQEGAVLLKGMEDLAMPLLWQPAQVIHKRTSIEGCGRGERQTQEAWGAHSHSRYLDNKNKAK